MSFDERAEARLIEVTRDIAAAEILPRFRALAPADVDSKSGPDDLVTEADRRSEARLEEFFRRLMPDAAFIGEEAVAEGRASVDALKFADRAVIVDPVDGTWNFAHGLAVFGVILAVVEAGETIWGGVYDPLDDDWVLARKGGGAFVLTRDGRRVPISASGGPTTIGAAHGFASTFMFKGENLKNLAAAFRDFRRIGNLRCSAHEYRQLAQGHVDFGLSAQLHPWDHAAGALVAAEAGATARLIDGTAYSPTLTKGRMLVARNEDLWQAVAERLSFLRDHTVGMP